MCRTIEFRVLLTLICCPSVSFRFWGCCAPASCCVAESETLHTSLSLQMAPTLRGGVSQHLTHAEFAYEPGEGMTVTYLSLSKDTGHAGITYSFILMNSLSNPLMVIVKEGGGCMTFLPNSTSLFICEVQCQQGSFFLVCTMCNAVNILYLNMSCNCTYLPPTSTITTTTAGNLLDQINFTPPLSPAKH